MDTIVAAHTNPFKGGMAVRLLATVKEAAPLLAEGVAQLAGENRRGAGAELRIPALVGRPCLLGSP